MAIANLREVYGIRKVDFKEKEKTVRVEYDASRLTEALVHQLLRRAGLDIVEEVSLIPPQLPPPEAPADAAPAAAPAK